ncbi:MAG TPA: hypothetical protein VIL20_20985, partial [Sandaracinaceae bacterium]
DKRLRWDGGRSERGVSPLAPPLRAPGRSGQEPVRSGQEEGAVEHGDGANASRAAPAEPSTAARAASCDAISIS